ncbi:MAG TPA: hypothetical protein VGR00_08530 [Thermoanaerobaculia bacterium]|nr:hypothetical protein [Thermoanaerobaculia bacterium]
MSAIDVGPLLVVSALPEELVSSKKRLSGRRFVFGVTGDGPANAARALEAFIEKHRPRAIVAIGIAGALSPGLRFGDVLVAERIVGDGATAPPPDAGLLASAERAGARRSTLVTVTAPVTSVGEKEKLLSELGTAGLVAVDMESAAWARVAASHGVPFVVLRAISDDADTALPVFLAGCLGVDGGIDRGRVVRYALVHPAVVPSLVALRKVLVGAAERLGPVVEIVASTELRSG